MAGPFYVRSTDGNNADSGLTWALAKATLAGATAVESVSDTIYVSQAHVDPAVGAALTFTLNTSLPASFPNRVLCANDGAEPPTALATGVLIACGTGTFALSIAGTVYVYGLNFQSGSTGGNISCGNTNDWQKFEQCQFIIPSTSASAVINIGGAAVTVEWKNCSIKFGAAGQRISIAGNNDFHWNGGSSLSGTTSPTTLLNISGSGGRHLLENIDLSNFGNGFNLVNARGPVGARTILRNIKVPSSWSGALLTSTTAGAGGRVEAYNVNGGAVNYKVWIEDQWGAIRDETVIVRTGGATDGTTPIAWKMSSNSGAGYPDFPLPSQELIRDYETTPGSSVTVTVEYLHDTNVAAGQGAGASNAFTNRQVWLEVNYFGDSATPQGTLVSSQPTDILAAATDNSTGVGTGSWTTTGVTTPKSGKLSVTFTPQMKGFFIARVMVAGVSKTIYVDPKLTIT